MDATLKNVLIAGGVAVGAYLLWQWYNGQTAQAAAPASGSSMAPGSAGTAPAVPPPPTTNPYALSNQNHPMPLKSFAQWRAGVSPEEAAWLATLTPAEQQWAYQQGYVVPWRHGMYGGP